MSGHTPGPWSLIVDDAGDGSEIYGFDVSAPNGRGIAYYDANDDPETEANARLIAAAPELLEALKAVELARMSDEPDDWQRATDLTDAALAKAGAA